MATNNSLAVFLVDDRVQCVKVAYDKADSYGKVLAKDVKSFKTFDNTLKVGDLVTIPCDTRWGFTVGSVTEVNCLVNYANPEEMRWIAGKVDKGTYDELLKQEHKLIGNVAKAEEQSARSELAAKLKALNPDMAAGLTMIGNPAPDRTGTQEFKRGGRQTPSDEVYILPPAPDVKDPFEL